MYRFLQSEIIMLWIPIPLPNYFAGIIKMNTKIQLLTVVFQLLGPYSCHHHQVLFLIPFTGGLHWQVEDAEMEMLSLFSSQTEGSGAETNFIPRHEEGIQTSLLPLEGTQPTLTASWEKKDQHTLPPGRGEGTAQSGTRSARKSG